MPTDKSRGQSLVQQSSNRAELRLVKVKAFEDTTMLLVAGAVNTWIESLSYGTDRRHILVDIYFGSSAVNDHHCVITYIGPTIP